MTGMITSLQHLSVNDGPGIRTIAFLKGCPLNCRWCHNPEMQHSAPEIAYRPEQCITCLSCVSACPHNCHIGDRADHRFDRTKCDSCGKCVAVCPSALSLCGHAMTAGEVVQELLADRVFYGSFGGITLSGGEPLMQAVFCLEILKKCKESGLHTCIETCGYVPWEHIEPLLPVTDLFLYDWKLTENTLHRTYTGVSNILIRENLLRINENGGKIILRCPIIPSVNDNLGHFHGIAELADSLDGIKHIEIMPYHDIWKAKARSYGLEASDTFSIPSKETVNKWLTTLQGLTQKTVSLG